VWHIWCFYTRAAMELPTFVSHTALLYWDCHSVLGSLPAASFSTIGTVKGTQPHGGLHKSLGMRLLSKVNNVTRTLHDRSSCLM
jgi:hypothetical protein